MIQYLSKFIPHMSDISAPLRKLLEGDTEWYWEENQKMSFEHLKQLATNAATLKYYDVVKPVTLSVDASSEGIGAVILQEGQPVAYGSRALTDYQRRYAQIEKELLSIVYGCEKFHQFLYWKDIQLESNHKPLESIFKKALHQALVWFQMYNFSYLFFFHCKMKNKLASDFCFLILTAGGEQIEDHAVLEGHEAKSC